MDMERSNVRNGSKLREPIGLASQPSKRQLNCAMRVFGFRSYTFVVFARVMNSCWTSTTSHRSCSISTMPRFWTDTLKQPGELRMFTSRSTRGCAVLGSHLKMLANLQKSFRNFEIYMSTE